MTKSSVEEYISDPNNKRTFLQERAILEVTKQLEEAMEQKGVSRAELARRLGKTKGWVTQMLDGEANKTIRTIADAFAVLGLEYRSSYGQIQISNAVQINRKTPSVRCVTGSAEAAPSEPQNGAPTATAKPRRKRGRQK